MKALTLYQPRASLVALREKKIETRSWATNYRGLLAIHAAQQGDFDLCRQRPFVEALNKHGIVMVNDMPVGSIVAIVNLVDCFKVRALRPVKRKGIIVQTAFLEAGNRLLEVDGNELAFGDYTPGRFAWILEDIKPVHPPISAKGHQRLWNWEPPEGFLKGGESE